MASHRTSSPLALGLSLVLVAPASAQMSEVTIEVDATEPGEALEPIWNYLGYDEANYTTTDEGRELLSAFAGTQTTAPYVRTHFLFNTGDGTPSLKWGSTNLYTEDESGEPRFEFSILEEILDTQIEAGMIPLFEIGFMPQALSTQPDPYENSGPFALDGGAFYPPDDYEEWGEVVRTFAGQVKDRYPDAEETWLFELWNEPDIAYFQGTFEEFTRLYDFTEAALHEVLPEARLGGPAIARPGEDFFSEFLAHCASGTNAVTGEVGTRLDFVSFHAKGGTTLVDKNVRMDLGNQLALHRAGFEQVRDSDFAEAPIYITEADPDGCAACTSTTAHHLDYRNSPAYGAYVAAMMKKSFDLAQQLQVDLRGVLTWAFTFPGSPYFHGQRALATNGVVLPVFNALKLLGNIEGARLSVTSSGALSVDELTEEGARPVADVDALATIDGESIHVLVYNYHDDLAPSEGALITIDLEVPEAFEHGALVMHTRVDATHGNAHAIWEEQGRPEQPTEEQRQELLNAADGLAYEADSIVGSVESRLRLTFELPRFGVSHLRLVPAREEDTTPSLEEQTAAPGGDCSCRAFSGKRTSSLTPLIFLLALPLARRRYAALRAGRRRATT